MAVVITIIFKIYSATFPMGNLIRDIPITNSNTRESFWMLESFPLVCDQRCFRTLLNSAILGCLNPKSGPWELSLSAASFCLHCLLEHKIIPSLSLMKVAFLIEYGRK
ncbi:hypothetical protein SLE2022_198680 [Rubroshorea leprosula]